MLSQGDSELAALCVPDEVAANERSSAPDTSHDGTLGCVYLMKSGKYYKIGHTMSLGRRAYDLAIQLPEKLTLVHSIKTDDPAGIESYWHKRFLDRHKNGEWYALTAQDVAAFKRRKFM